MRKVGGRPFHVTDAVLRLEDLALLERGAACAHGAYWLAWKQRRHCSRLTVHKLTPELGPAASAELRHITRDSCVRGESASSPGNTPEWL